MKVLNIYISSTIEDFLENRVSAPFPLPALHRKGEYNQIECFLFVYEKIFWKKIVKNI